MSWTLFWQIVALLVLLTAVCDYLTYSYFEERKKLEQVRKEVSA